MGIISLERFENATALNKLEKDICTVVKESKREGILQPDQDHQWLVRDLTAGEPVVSINAGQQFQTGCRIKPYIALSFFHLQQAGQLVYGPRSKRNMEAMIQESGNLASRWLLEQVGGPEGAQAILIQYANLFDRIPPMNPIPDNGREYGNTLSAEECARFLTSLHREELPGSGEIKRLMGLPKKNAIVDRAPGIPEDTPLYCKTGSNGFVAGDMGVVEAVGRDGEPHPYLFVGVVQRKRRLEADLMGWWDWLGTQRNVIRKVSGLVYEHFNRKYDLAR